MHSVLALLIILKINLAKFIYLFIIIIIIIIINLQYSIDNCGNLFIQFIILHSFGQELSFFLRIRLRSSNPNRLESGLSGWSFARITSNIV